jgi:hypothetical protein
VTARTAARLAWSLCAGCVAGIGGLLVLKVLNGPADLRSAPLVAAPLAFAVVGALVASRQQRNPVGWQLLAVGVFMTAILLGESYARYALITAPGSLPGGLYGPWLGWTYAPALAILAIFLPQYFPTGRLLSPRWRPVVWLGIGFLVFAVAGNALWPGPQPPLPGLAPVPNPGGVPAPGHAAVPAVPQPGWAVPSPRDRWGHRRAGGAISTFPRDRNASS